MRIVIFGTLLSLFFEVASAADFEENQHTLPRFELYPGVNTALREIAREDYRRKNLLLRSRPAQGDEELSAKLLSCDKETLSINIWLASRHERKERKQELNEKNRGAGFLYSCDALSLGIDQMVNSNKGKAQVFSVVWSTPRLEIGPLFAKGNIGYAKISYEVPKYNTTLHEKTGIAYLGFGLRAFDQLTVNVAPVPKMAGKAYILWVQYRVLDLRAVNF